MTNYFAQDIRKKSVKSLMKVELTEKLSRNPPRQSVHVKSILHSPINLSAV